MRSVGEQGGRGRAALTAIAATLLLAGCASSKPTWQPYPTMDRSFEALTGDQRNLVMHDVLFEDDAGEVRSLSELRGKVVLLHYWASWCPECREELASLQELRDSMAHFADLEILAVNALEPFEDGVAWARDNEISMPLLRRVGESPASNEVLPKGSYAIDTVPRTFVISRDGLIVARYDRPRPWEFFDSALQTLIAHREYRLPETFHSKAVIAAHGAHIDARARPVAAQQGLHELNVQIQPRAGTRLSADYGITIAPRPTPGVSWRSNVPVNLTVDGDYIEHTQTVPLQFTANGLRRMDIDIYYGVCAGNGSCTDAHQVVRLAAQ